MTGYRRCIIISKFQYYSLEHIIRFFLEQGKEGECWDFKQEWHTNTEDLIKDIICFANTVHDENCYLVFGVSDDLKITGMQKPRTKQSDIIDTISHLVFAGDVYPKIEVKTIQLDGFDIDVLIIFNIESTPIFLKKPYGKMREGCIYLRIGDKNTPNLGNADVTDIENLWRKRLGLTKPPLEYIYDRMHNKLEWTERDESYYNIYRPEYTLQIIHDNDCRREAEFYAYAMMNSNTSYEMLNVMYQTTVLESFQLVVLDGGRLEIPTPEWGFVCHEDYDMNPKYSYKYYVLGSPRYRVLTFLYDPKNSEAQYALKHLQDVVLVYNSQEEKLAFETYLEGNHDIVKEYLERVDKYNYVKTGDEHKTYVYREQLKIGVALNNLLSDWRKKQISQVK